MSVKNHLRPLTLAIGLWAAFWVAGLPDYYLQYPFAGMLGLCIPVAIAIALIARGLLLATTPEQRRTYGWWLSFYFTVPVLGLDYLYCGVHLGHGWGFLGTYWYLTAFYVIPWFIIVPIARRLSTATTT